jgi:hypothetical protein
MIQRLKREYGMIRKTKNKSCPFRAKLVKGYGQLDGFSGQVAWTSGGKPCLNETCSRLKQKRYAK